MTNVSPSSEKLQTSRRSLTSQMALMSVLGLDLAAAEDFAFLEPRVRGLEMKWKKYEKLSY